MELSEALLCLTLAIFKEAEGESHAGKRWVGDTVINRVNSKTFPNDVCGVVLQPKQFSWANSMKDRSFFGLVDYQNFTLHKIGYNQNRLRSYRESEKLARRMLDSGYKTSHKFFYFHSGSRVPEQAKSKRIVTVGNHFYY